MSLTIVVGGQFGSEGKGKICSYLARETDLMVRTGGPNSGHTVVQKSTAYALQQIPAGFVNSECALAVAADAVVDVEIFLKEVQEFGLDNRVFVDPCAVMVTDKHKKLEGGLRKSIGSTGSGTGAATISKIKREPGTKLAHECQQLNYFLRNVGEMVNEYLDNGQRVLIEGTQGVGLSIHHGEYPYVTSRDTTPGTMCGDVGVSPRLVDEIILTLRTYPIRVGGNSGHLESEIDWETLTSESYAPFPIVERTTVTKRIRRIGRFDLGLVRKSVRIVRPTKIALNFLDYLDYKNRGVTSLDNIDNKAAEFVSWLERETNTPVCLLGTGPEVNQVIDLRSEKKFDNNKLEVKNKILSSIQA